MAQQLTLSRVHFDLDWLARFLQLDEGYALLKSIFKEEPRKTMLRSQPGLLDILAQCSSVALDERVVVTIVTDSELQHRELRYSQVVEEIGRRHGLLHLERLLEHMSIDSQEFIICVSSSDFEALLVDLDKAEGMSAESMEFVQLIRQVVHQASEFVISLPSAMLDPFEADLPIIGQEMLKHAYFQSDLSLASRFAHCLCRNACKDLETKDGLISQDAKSTVEMVIKHESVYRCILKAVKLMHARDYEYADVVLVLSYASVYFRSAFACVRKKVGPDEVAHMIALLIFLAQTFILDQACPLRVWRKQVFPQNITLKVVNALTVRLLQKGLGCKLTITYEEERAALLGLLGMKYHGFKLRILDDAGR